MAGLKETQHLIHRNFVHRVLSEYGQTETHGVF